MFNKLLGKVPVHPTEDLLEEYGFGRVHEPALTALEEHLLVCSLCQIRLVELDEYAALMKTALAGLEDRPKAVPALSRGWSIIPGIPVSSAIVAVALMLVFVSANVAWRSQPVPQTATVRLAAFRGGESSGISQAPSGRPLDLTADRTNLPPAPGYRVELVSQNGEKIWAGEAEVIGTRLSAHVAAGLRPGVYWIRLYTSQVPGSRSQLLREYGMRLE